MFGTMPISIALQHPQQKDGYHTHYADIFQHLQDLRHAPSEESEICDEKRAVYDPGELEQLDRDIHCVGEEGLWLR